MKAMARTLSLCFAAGAIGGLANKQAMAGSRTFSPPVKAPKAGKRVFYATANKRHQNPEDRKGKLSDLARRRK